MDDPLSRTGLLRHDRCFSSQECPNVRARTICVARFLCQVGVHCSHSSRTDTHFRGTKKRRWVAGLGSKNSQSGDLSGYLVYAMRVEEVLSLREYDQQANARWPYRIRNVRSADLSERLGGCIYPQNSQLPSQRHSVHDAGNVETDLGSENVLISHDFYYFGRRPSGFLTVSFRFVIEPRDTVATRTIPSSISL